MVKEIRASHILVKTEDKAKELLTKIQTGQPFEKIAETESQCPSRKKGGDLGWFGRGSMVRAFENTAFNLKKGELGIIRTEFGWHIIKKTDEK
ncbi:MAG TPA: peptidylprolyl isomerase [Candidatus Nanoarchaeia archaeon]|nr:peptidylprolyl isomerase [Candidatus Nanoarchaeia archaeon]